MATATYKFTGVPKTFTSKAAAIKFLSNSPGYVSRQSGYLNKYWPGLMAELEQTTRKRQALDKRRNSKPVTQKPTAAAKKYSAERTIFVPPAFTTAPKSKATKTPPWLKSTAAPVDPTTEREKFQLGLSKKKQTPNVADLVPAPRPKGGGLGSFSLDPLRKQADLVGGIGKGIAGAVEGAARDIGGGISSDILGTLGAAQSRGPVQQSSPVPPAAQKAARVVQPAADRLVGTTSSVADFTLGKGLANLAQGQLPKDWKDVAGLGVGVAAVLPIGRLGKSAASIAKIDSAARQQRLIDRMAKAVARAHTVDEIAEQRAALAGMIGRGSDDAALRVQDDILARSERILGGNDATGTAAGRAAGRADSAGVGGVRPRTGGALEGDPGSVGAGAVDPLNLNVEAVPRTPEAIDARVTHETVRQAFAGVDDAIVEKNAINSQERAIRAKGAMKAYHEAGGGSEGIKAAKGELRGAFPQIDWNGFTELSPEAVDAMIRSVDFNPEFGFYDLLHISEGLDRATSGLNVQQHQLNAIRRALGDDVAAQITAPVNRTFWQRLYNAGIHIWNIPRAIMASFDLSAPFRQGLVAGTRHPIIFARNFKPMVKSFGSERITREIAEEIPTRANFQRYGIGDLKFTDMLGMREEQWPGSYVDNWYGIKNSARAYSTFLNKMRADMFDHLVDVAAKHGKNIDDPQFLKALGEHVMNATGRGKIPGGDAGESAANFLNQFLFSPRLLASRFQILNPVYYGRLTFGAKKDRFVALEAAKSLATTIGGISAMVYLASNIPGAKVGINPLSADFGKVRIGNTRFDFAAGFQPLIVLYSRWIKNEYVSSSTNKKTKLGDGFGIPMRGDLFLRFMESKMAPSPRLVWDIANGENFVGEAMTPRNIAAGMAPLNLQGAWEAGSQESVPMGVAAGLLGSIGAGVNTYPDKASESDKKKSASPPWAKGSSSTKARTAPWLKP